ncbi:glycosyltransferase family 4 protein [Candidatus Wolfebacteria bacterium]|nr:glycosyltransferase family 4 protein [Candidatus Wolfebacteria bacterium]
MRERFLFISIDPDIRSEESEVFARMKSYARLCDELHILALIPANDNWNQRSDNLCVHGVRGLSRLARFIRGFFKVLSITKRQKFTGIITQDPFFLGFLGFAVGRIRHLPVSAGIYGSNVFDPYWRRESLQNRLYALIGRFVLPRVSVIETDTHELVGELEERFGVPVVWKPVIPQNIERFKIARRAYNRVPLKVLFVGRLVPQKNIPLLLATVQKVNERWSGKVTFTIIGSGQYEKEVRDATGDTVAWLSSVERDTMPAVFAEHDVFLLTSYHEGFARVSIEAAASGMPILSTRVGGVESVVSDGISGYIFGQGVSAEVLAGAICDLENHRDRLKKMSEAIQDHFWNNFSRESLARNQSKLFNVLATARQAYG